VLLPAEVRQAASQGDLSAVDNFFLICFLSAFIFSSFFPFRTFLCGHFIEDIL